MPVAQNDITNSAGQEIDSLTSSAGYKQIIDKPIFIVNNSMSLIDLLFCTNQNTISNYGVDVSIFDKCHHNIILASLTTVYHSFQYISVKSGITVKQTWKNIQYAISNFNWNKAFENLSVDGKVKHLNETLLNIFRNYIPNRKIKCDYRQPIWINGNIKIYYQ